MRVGAAASQKMPPPHETLWLPVIVLLMIIGEALLWAKMAPPLVPDRFPVIVLDVISGVDTPSQKMPPPKPAQFPLILLRVIVGDASVE